MSEFLSFLSEIGVYPLLVLLWLKLDQTQKAHITVIQYLEEICPNCSKVKVLLPK